MPTFVPVHQTESGRLLSYADEAKFEAVRAAEEGDVESAKLWANEHNVRFQGWLSYIAREMRGISSLQHARIDKSRLEGGS